ncbi:hypothetical protein E1B28_001222 [Marasmius oreades]|uniref:Hypervirulence associated protein TUDOR domain-containing protein n=1 Tax=Marasmius oreades TaxID=181124 RepID=A0A9P7V2Y4_9AGAR|nr:uncharacterized protein E1B28_001222 [Marasmius oreades]KAG7099366.1 hypothetical protein E1B28_001222 [Marasmius oreades]
MSPSHNQATTQEYEPGDHVQYQAIGGGNASNSTTTGEVVEVVESKRPAGETGVKVNASKDDPRYVIRNDNTDKETAYKSSNIEGLVDE